MCGMKVNFCYGNKVKVLLPKFTLPQVLPYIYIHVIINTYYSILTNYIINNQSEGIRSVSGVHVCDHITDPGGSRFS